MKNPAEEYPVCDGSGLPDMQAYKPHDWWASLFVELGYTVVWAEDKEFVSLLYITR